MNTSSPLTHSSNFYFDRDRSRMLNNAFYTLLLPLIFFFSSSVFAGEQVTKLKECHLKGIREKVRCGSIEVPENYKQPNDRTISINYAVLPAIDQSQNKAPLMLLAGGPGQASVELASSWARSFRKIRNTRDLILIDQRGTGQSNPLHCPEMDNQDIYSILPEDLSEQDVRDCVTQFKGNLSQYNTENAIRDFNTIRQSLGYSKVHVYGGSYGTRAALIYMRLFPETIESVTLDGVAPIELPIGLFGKSTERSFQLLIDKCHKTPTCHAAYPNLEQEFNALAARLEKQPAKVEIIHPRLGTPTTLKISKYKLINLIQLKLYSTETRTLVPLAIHQAFENNYRPLAGFISQISSSQKIYTGLQYNIVCNEDYPRISIDEFTRDAQNNFQGDSYQKSLQLICSNLPEFRPEPEFYTPITANIPTLILSGNLDPVTPPSNGEYTSKSLPNSRHIVIENLSHGMTRTACTMNIINEFIEQSNPNGLDTQCIEDIPDESFMTSLNGGI